MAFSPPCFLSACDRVPGHRRVPPALRAEHRLEHGLGHVAVEGILGTEEGLEEPLVLRVLDVDLLREEGPVLRRQRVEALHADRLHGGPRQVHPEHPDPVRAGEEEDVAVVVPVVPPVLVPVGLREEALLGERLVRVPAVEPLLLGHRVHLEAHEDLPAPLVQLLDNAELDVVELAVGVALAHEQQLHAVEARRELRRGERVALRRVGDAVEHDGGLAVLAGGVADRQVEGALVGPEGGKGAGREESGNQQGALHGVTSKRGRRRGAPLRGAYQKMRGGRW